MGVYLKFVGVIILFCGLLLGGFSLSTPGDCQNFDKKLSKIDKSYGKIGKELGEVVTKKLENFSLFQQKELREARGISLIVGAIVIGSLFLGLGEAISLLKKIFKKL